MHVRASLWVVLQVYRYSYTVDSRALSVSGASQIVILHILFSKGTWTSRRAIVVVAGSASSTGTAGVM